MIIRRKVSTIGWAEYPIASASEQPCNILEQIVWAKELEVKKLDAQLKIQLEKSPDTAPPVRNFLQALNNSPHPPALIAEVKKASPSKGLLRQNFDAVAIARAYSAGGANCLSVLTDAQFFEGSFQNLRLIRANTDLPLLCKEFIIDPVQIHWARLHGADAILLITAILNNTDLQALHQLARSLSMTVLVEVHTPQELERVLGIPDLQLIGINNRNLSNFTVDLSQTQKLLAQLTPDQRHAHTWVSESGIYSRADLDNVLKAGVQAVLVGESLLKQSDLQQAIHKLYA